MEQIAYMDSVMDEHDWLYTPGMTDAWHVYYKPAMHLDVVEYETFSGELPLADVVSAANAHAHHDFATEHIDDILCVLVSGRPIEQFYPHVKENFPAEIAFFDGGDWYWTQNCESGEELYHLIWG